MNFFDHHIGDYDEATSHLTACEDGIYHRLIRKYYAKEKPLPADIPKLQRWVRAKTEDEKQAVIDVVEEFFALQADGYHQKTCDEGIAAYQAGEPERVVKKANEHNRVTRHRLERSRLFQVLVTAGQHAPWNIGMDELRKLAGAISQPTDTPATAKAREPATNGTVTATAPATPATATQTPVPPPTTQMVLSSGGAPEPAARTKRKPRSKAAPKEEGPTTAAFDAYSAAYKSRYGVAPLRNATVSGQLSNFITRVPAEEAPLIAAFYVGHNNGLYVSAKHPVNLLVRDAERLRTDWATGDAKDRRPQAPNAKVLEQERVHSGLSGGRTRAAPPKPPGPQLPNLQQTMEMVDAKSSE